MGFPDDDMYGVDVVIPDVSYLVKNKSRIRGYLHHPRPRGPHRRAAVCDETGSTLPIYATRLTAGLVRAQAARSTALLE